MEKLLAEKERAENLATERLGKGSLVGGVRHGRLVDEDAGGGDEGLAMERGGAAAVWVWAALGVMGAGGVLWWLWRR